ncbi:hypothetical protein FUT87_01465 [Mitsuaria sp. TWR114]|uniref:hypothetical protein n=1 Tax=unclassified Roseateles TaxID=2626991 RepID=UPI0008E9378F|nr:MULTISPECIES: hypothetical protein [unclassified Roseateles]MBB3293634.1 hypothetical protein [Mitsuaria sp. BK041]MBB3362851.1 hypothetical protein [Mitsuaria sp. BK045]TXD99938.1 hypothetical protein FUT87_01465 [Mitsuaria sp. TWR114]SFR81608.1 hypothetical protein SAMN05428960_2279 [Mitsuaria sp. PDC51]
MTTDTCQQLRRALLDLHRALVDLERGDFEKQHGPQSAGEFLQVMAFSEDMRWLEPLSRLITMLDEAIDGAADAAATPRAVAQRARDLLGLDRDSADPFKQRYAQRFDQSPPLVHAHTAAIAALKAVGTVAPGPRA